MLLLLSQLALASSPEVCDGIDNDVDGLIDDGGVCGTESVNDTSTGHAYAIFGDATRDGADVVCAAEGYHPADPSSAAENAVLDFFSDSGTLWLGIERVAGVTVTSQGAPQFFDDYVDPPGSDGCTLYNGSPFNLPYWQFVDEPDCPTLTYAVLCEADCSQITVYIDNDSDGYGGGSGIGTCAPVQPGYSTQPGDCNDFNPAERPGNAEVCDGLDNDCNGQIDDGLTALTVYVDADGDGFGAGPPMQACSVEEGFSDNDSDCDDEAADRYPGAVEQCNGIDDDCDGTIDNDAPPIDWFFDGDGDGYGVGVPVSSCSEVPGHVTEDGDCDDADDTRSPGIEEVCNSVDDDCDGIVDTDTVEPPAWYADTDLDGSGDPDDVVFGCERPPGRVATPGDCAPDDGQIHPNAPEACVDGVDNDCDGLVDADDPDFVDAAVTFWLDQDGDGVGVAGADFVGCSGTQPLGYVQVTAEEDCNDGDSSIAPGFEEVCDDVDNNCDGSVDEGFTQYDYFPDGDLDGYGDELGAPVSACAPPLGWVRNQLDCDDADPSLNPEATETCDGTDEDCDNLIDDGLTFVDYFADNDGDGFGAGDATSACSPVVGAVMDNTDCDDTDGDIYPGAPDDPEDLVDSDCDGTVETPPTPPPVDSDGDGVPDDIDPSPNGSTAGEQPGQPVRKYGCGCTQGAVERPSWLWLFGRRR